MRIEVDISKIIGKGYKDYWFFQGRYRVCKGSRASKKSKTTALNFIYRIMKYPNSNLVVIRKVFNTLKDSCYTDLKWAINKLKVNEYWECKLSPLELVYKPTGQKILFRGLDEPMKIASITVEVGQLCWAWFEEAYEIEKEEDFNMVDESIRGEVADGLFKQITVTLNPWHEGHWIKPRFFDKQNPIILAKTTNFMCNEFLDDADKSLFERMRIENPRRFLVAGKGEWGISEGLIYENWEIKDFNPNKIVEKPFIVERYGLDYGYSPDPLALICMLVSFETKEIWIFDEHYEHEMGYDDIYQMLIDKGYTGQLIKTDTNEKRSNKYLTDMGINVEKATKGPDSIKAGIRFIRDFKIYVHPKCKNTIEELSTYCFATDRRGNRLQVPIDKNNHLMDAGRYALVDDMDKNISRTLGG